MTTKRVFLGVPVQAIPNYEQLLTTLSHDLDIKLTITNPERYHFTVHFFGEISDTIIANIIDALGEFTFEKIVLKLHHGGIIPNNKPNKVRVLYIEPTENAIHLEELVKELKSRIRSVGFKIPKRKYLTHLTVGRVKWGKDRAKLCQRWLSLDLPEISLELDRLQLIHSTLTPHGPIYKTLFEIEGK